MDCAFFTTAIRILQTSLFVLVAFCSGASVTASARTDRPATELVSMVHHSRPASIREWKQSTRWPAWTSPWAKCLAAMYDQRLVCIQLKCLPVLTNFNTQSLQLIRMYYPGEPGEEPAVIS